MASAENAPGNGLSAPSDVSLKEQEGSSAVLHYPPLIANPSFVQGHHGKRGNLLQQIFITSRCTISRGIMTMQNIHGH